MTPLDYLTYCRLDKAKQLLTETSQSVPEVSEAIGYPAHEHFQNCLKKLAKLLALTEKKIPKGINMYSSPVNKTAFWVIVMGSILCTPPFVPLFFLCNI